ncbi:MAG: hypothetical protein AAGF68_00420 [Pseudomonadota bacterium]
MTDFPPISSQAAPRLVSVILLALLAFSLASVLAAFALDFAADGNVWKQGDWLINTLNTEIRRGPLGTFILRLSDLFNLDPVLAVLALQALLLFPLYALFARAALWPGLAVPALLLLASPALFVLFWANDLQANGRKELLGMLGILLALVARGDDRNSLLILSVPVMAIAFIGHEVNLLLLPLYAALLLVGSEPYRRGRVIAVVLVALAAGAAFFYAISHPRIEDLNLICAPLLERGVPERFCAEGAISWMERTSAQDRDMVLARNLPDGQPLIFILAYILAALPFAYLISRSSAPGRWALIALATVLPFLPLYAVALDWGRWMALHAFSAAIILIAGLRFDWLRLARPIDWRILAVCVAVGLLWAQRQIIGIRWGGTVDRGLEVLGQALG